MTNLINPLELEDMSLQPLEHPHLDEVLLILNDLGPVRLDNILEESRE
jgi:hypothetical protein